MSQVSLDQMSQSLQTTSVLVSFPTDTVPALAARPEDAQLIYVAKQRPPEKPLILMGASFRDLSPYIQGDTVEMDEWQKVCDRYWPGQLTLVLPASDLTPPNLNPLHSGSIGIRVPNHPGALQLLSKTGPLATTSANLSGQPPLTTATDITRIFPAALILTTSLYTHASGQPSTVAKWIGTKQAGARWQILRQGNIHL